MAFIEVPFSLITVETEYNHPMDNNEGSCFGKFVIYDIAYYYYF